MPKPMWLILVAACLIVFGHFVVASLTDSPCLSTLLICIGLILGIIIGTLGHYRNWMPPLGKGEGYPEPGGLAGSSFIMGLVVIFASVLSGITFSEAAWASPMRLFLFALTYFISSEAIRFAYPPTLEDTWSRNRQKAIDELNLITLIVTASAGFGLALGSLIAGDFLEVQLMPTSAFFLCLAGLHAIFAWLGWDDKKRLFFRRFLGFTLVAYSIISSASICIIFGLLNANQDTALLITCQGILVGSLCAIPLLHRANYQSQTMQVTFYLLGFINVLIYLRWINTTMPPGAGLFFASSLGEVLLILAIWPRTQKKPRVRKPSKDADLPDEFFEPKGPWNGQ